MTFAYRSALVGIALFLSIPVAAGTSSKDRLSSLWRNHGALVFAAAASTTETLVPVSERALGEGWQSWFFVHLLHRRAPEDLNAAFTELRAEYDALPSDERYAAMQDMELWVVSYRALEALEATTGPEAFGSAVAWVPAVSAEFPRDREFVERFGPGVGSSLASAEISGLMYAVATRLSGMETRARATAIRDLYTKALEDGRQ